MEVDDEMNYIENVYSSNYVICSISCELSQFFVDAKKLNTDGFNMSNVNKRES